MDHRRETGNAPRPRPGAVAVAGSAFGRPCRSVRRQGCAGRIGSWPSLRQTGLLWSGRGERDLDSEALPSFRKLVVAMKLGVDGRFLSDAEIRSRGMGRYSLNQIEALQQHRPDVELTLLIRPDGRKASRRLASGLRIIEVPPELGTPLPAPLTRASRLGRDADYAAWLSGLGLDALLSTAPFFTLLEPQPPLPGVFPTVVNLYDLIPLVYRHQYFAPGSPEERVYFGVLERVPFGDSFVAISEFVRRESTTYLGLPARRVHVGYPLPAGVFRPVARDAAYAAMERLGLSRAAEDGFVLTVPHSHHSKNVRTLLEAWSLLPGDFRRRRSLVLTCDLVAPHEERLRSWIREAGIDDEVVLTGFVSDQDLAALYSAAWLYVHPSRYEGFGLPVVEANACGTAVISSWAASLPEAVGDAGLLVDPESPASFRDALLRVDDDPVLLASLREKATGSAGRFRAESLAGAIVSGAESAIDRRRPTSRRRGRPRVALVSPAPPPGSEVAGYTLDLASALAPRADIELFVDEGVSPVSALYRWPVHSVSRLEERASLHGFDAVLQHVAASPPHRFTGSLERALPVIVTLHGLPWGGVAQGVASSSTEPEATPNTLESLDEFFRRFPVAGDVVRASRGVVVHLPAIEAFVRSRHPEIPVRYVPMGVADPLRAGIRGRLAARTRLGLPQKGFVVVAVRLADSGDGLDVVIEAIARLAKRGGAVSLAIACSAADEACRTSLATLSGGLGYTDLVRFLDSPHVADLEMLLGSCDAVLSLGDPPRMQVPTVLVRALAAGVPVAMRDLPEWRFLPRGACEWIPKGPGEVDDLVRFLERLLAEPGERALRGAVARRWYLESATLDRMAEGYMSFLHDVGGCARETEAETDQGAALSPGFSAACNIEHFSSPGLLPVLRDVFQDELSGSPSFPAGRESRESWEVAMTVRALRELGAMRRDARILGVCVGVGAETTAAYLTRHVGEVVVTGLCLRGSARDEEARVFESPDGGFDGIFSLSAIEHLGSDDEIAAAAFEMGRVLRPGGILALTTDLLLMGPSGARGGAEGRPFTEADLRRLIVEASGLELVGDLDVVVSSATLESPRDLAAVVDGVAGGEGPNVPHLVVIDEGQVFTSIQVVLRKSAAYPVSENSWAAPKPAPPEKALRETGSLREGPSGV